MIRCLIVPHAPLLLDLPGRQHPAPEIRAALRDVAASLGDAPTILVSSHGPAAGIYRINRGSLGPLGSPEQRADVPTEEVLGDKLRSAWDVGYVDEPLDHGAVVPSIFLGMGPTVVASLPGWTGQTDGDPKPALAAARDLATAIADVCSGAATVLLSAHSSAALGPRAPLPNRPEGPELDAALFDALRTDVRAIDDIPPELWRAGAACGAGPLTVLANLAAGPAEILATAAPFGVGYIVAGCDA